MTRRLLPFLISFCAGLPGGAFAQVAQSETGSSGDFPTTTSRIDLSDEAEQTIPGTAPEQISRQNESVAQLDEIIVTARRRDERLQDVPVAMTALSKTDIERYQTSSFAQIAAQTPNLIVADSGNVAGGTVNLRGIGGSVNSSSVDQSVSINIDGVQIGQGFALRLGTYDLQRVEVLKGPQALFYGKNSPAGIVSIISEDPDDSFEASIRTGYEVYQEQKFAEITVSGPLTSNIGARLVAYASDQDGWFNNTSSFRSPESSGPQQTEQFYRGTITYGSREDVFSANLKVSYTQDQSDNNRSWVSQFVSCADPLGRDCDLDRGYQDSNIPPSLVLSPVFKGGKAYSDTDQWLNVLTMRYQLGDEYSLESITGYYQVDDAFNANQGRLSNDGLVYGSTTGIEQYSQELRLSSSYSGLFNFVAGAYYQHVDWENRTAVVFGPAAGFAPALLMDDSDMRQKTGAYSVFGQLIFDLSDRWEATLGARYSEETKEQHYRRFPSALSGFTLADPLPVAQDEITFYDFSPEATLSYMPTDDLTVYAALRRGFTSGGFNLAAFQAPNADNSYQPQTVVGGEVGMKGTTLDRQLRFDVAIYHYIYDDLQLSAFDPVSFALPLLNAAKATVEGVESSIDFSPRPVPGLRLRGTLSYNRAKYDAFPLAPCYPGQTIDKGCDRGFANGVFNAQDLAGQSLHRAPEWSGGIGIDYERPLTDDLLISFGADANYTDDYFGMPELTPESRQASVWKLNARVSILSADERWELSLIGTNLTNKLRAAQINPQPLTGSGGGTNGPAVLADLWGAPSEPRLAKVQIRYRF